MVIGLGILGWTPEVFYDASLDELLLAYQGFEERRKYDDFRAGNIMSLMANMKRDESKRSEPYQPADFFASLQSPADGTEEEESARVPELTPELFEALNRDPNELPQQPVSDGEVKSRG